jgi:protein pelota
MKVLRNLREGKVKVVPENLDDLWYLKGVIDQGDLVSGRTVRRIKDDEKLRADRGERVQVRLTLEVEDVGFHPSVTRLRILGKIVSGPEDRVSLGSYHTMDVKPGDTITIFKERWRTWELDRLREAERASKTPLVLMIAIEDDEAEVALVRRYGIDHLMRITGHVSGKKAPDKRESALKGFFARVAAALKEAVAKHGVKAVVVCGPGFVREDFMSYLRDREPEIAGICFQEGTGSGGRTGIQEAIKRGAVERAVKESRVSMETRLVERIFRDIGRDTGLATYGVREVEKALEIGAVDKLLVSDELVRKSARIERLMEKAKKTKGEVLLVSTEHEAGEKLLALGGVAALLRFRC